MVYKIVQFVGSLYEKYQQKHFKLTRSKNPRFIKNMTVYEVRCGLCYHTAYTMLPKRQSRKYIYDVLNWRRQKGKNVCDKCCKSLNIV